MLRDDFNYIWEMDYYSDLELEFSLLKLAVII
jgi:hypothetical protein